MGKVVPTQNQVMNKVSTGMKAGGAGGLAGALGQALAGPVGKAGGNIVAGASVGGTEGKILAVEGTRELVHMLAQGMLQGQSSGANSNAY